MTEIDYTIVNVADWVLKIIVLISFLALIAVFYSVLKKSKQKNSGAIGRSLILIVLLCISTIFNFTNVVLTVLYLSKKINMIVALYTWLFNIVLIVLNLLVPIGFAVYLYSPKKLSIKSIKQEALNWSGCCYRRKKLLIRGTNMRHTNIDDGDLKTIHNSSAGYVPSHTTWITAIPYTNEFTNIEESIMLNSGEAKYGAIK